MELIAYQQQRGRLYLCVYEPYKNEYFHEVKKKIIEQISFLESNGVSKIEISQSKISESCYVYVYFNGHKHPANIRISGHYNYNEDTLFIENPKDIKNMLHFNKLSCYIMMQEINEFENR